MHLAEMDSYGQYAEAYVSLVREGTLGCLLSRLARRLLCLAGDASGFKILECRRRRGPAGPSLRPERAGVLGR